jgi:hypothetical protein
MRDDWGAEVSEKRRKSRTLWVTVSDLAHRRGSSEDEDTAERYRVK